MMSPRIARSSDAAALAELSGQLGYPADAATISRRLHGITDSRTDVVLVAGIADDQVLGFAHAVARRSVTVDPFVDLVALVVDDAARGAGVGAALLAAVEEWARTQGFAVVRVRSNVIRTRAHHFYLREGYVEKKRQAVFIKNL